MFQVITQHFSELFMALTLSRQTDFLDSLTSRVSEEINKDFNRAFTHKKIQKALQ